MRRLTLTLPVAALLLLAPAPADAQQPVQPTPEELELINEGAAASDAGDFPRAIRALQRALRLGELNVTWLNLGRALQKDGQCYEAEDAFARALQAPPIAGLDPEVVAGHVARYREELLATCPGRIVIECPPGDLVLIDADSARHPLTCGAVSDPMRPGVYRALLTQDARQAEVLVEIRAMDTTRAALALEEAAPPPGEPLGLRLGLRYGAGLGWASGDLRNEGGQPLDRIPRDGAQDSLDGLQIARLGHALEATALFALTDHAWVGLRVEGRAPAPAALLGAQADLLLLRVAAFDVLGAAHLSWGAQDVGLRVGEQRFLAAAGPWHAGLEARLASPLTPSLGWSVGLGAHAALPDLALAFMLRGGLHLDL